MADHAIVLYGQTQTGKSTFLNQVLEPGQQGVSTGDGSGESVTINTSLRTTSIGPVVDGPGINDSMLGFRWAAAVAAANAERLKVLVFESLAAPAIQLRTTLASLVAAFAASILPGVVVVASQADLRVGRAREVRVQALRAAMAEQSINELVLWQHAESLDEAETDAQVGVLEAALERVPGVSTTQLADLWQRQRRRAQELCDRQSPRTREVQVEESFAEPYTEQEDYDEQEPYTHHEHYSVSVPYSEEEQYEENEPYTTIEKQAVPVEVTHTGKTWYGKKKRRTTLETKWVDVEVQKLRPVTRTRTVTKYRTEERTRPVTLYRTVTRQRAVTKYRTATRTVPRTVQYTRPVTDFYQTALGQIVEEVRATFRAQ
ncbi:unnamed protein product [Durusdinium trenchii]|uniref:G domain-containing protein n=1 Tax=Durusdinium trenchii TaxID=1381693 RepID=A0ABP0QH58_9DINO